MSELPQPIHEGNISEIVRGAERITEGQDSVIYRAGNIAIKRYLDLDLNQILDYQQITQTAAELLNGNVLDLNIDGKEPKVVINPIDQVIESETDLDVYAIAPFIEGKNLHQSKYGNQSQAELDNLSRQIIEESGYRGINIIPLNVKVGETESGISFVVTDICARVSDLAKL
jgi:hypothetical protein